MKKILLISIALLFGCTIFAQSTDDYPQYPIATYKCVQMSPDCNDPQPWGVLQSSSMLPDCFPPSCYAMSKNHHPTPPVSGPNSPITSYKLEIMKTDSPNYPHFHVVKPKVRFD